VPRKRRRSKSRKKIRRRIGILLMTVAVFTTALYLTGGALQSPVGENTQETLAKQDTVTDATIDTAMLSPTEEEPSPTVVLSSALFPVQENNPMLELNNVFGSKVIFVALAEPAYVLTENSDKHSIGSVLKDDRILTGISSDRIVLQHGGQLQIFKLPTGEEEVEE